MAAGEEAEAEAEESQGLRESLRVGVVVGGPRAALPVVVSRRCLVLALNVWFVIS